MEADWEVEIGADAPVIDANWAGFVDLSLSPERASQLPETAEIPALAAALIALNAQSGPVWTSKCDVWQPDAIDPDEVDAPSGAGNCAIDSAIACYIDILPQSKQPWMSLEAATDWCRRVCIQLHSRPLRCCRSDLIIRRVFLRLEDNPHQLELGVTVYLTACGSNRAEAMATVSLALEMVVDSTLSAGHPAPAASKLQ